MKLVKLKCEGCGANLKVNEENEMKNNSIRFIRCNQAQFETLKDEENIRAVRGLYMQGNDLYFVVDVNQYDGITADTDIDTIGDDLLNTDTTNNTQNNIIQAEQSLNDKILNEHYRSNMELVDVFYSQNEAVVGDFYKKQDISR